MRFDWLFVCQIVAAIQKILYATDDNGTAVAEAQAMISVGRKEIEGLSPIAEVSEEKSVQKLIRERILPILILMLLASQRCLPDRGFLMFQMFIVASHLL